MIGFFFSSRHVVNRQNPRNSSGYFNSHLSTGFARMIYATCQIYYMEFLLKYLEKNLQGKFAVILFLFWWFPIIITQSRWFRSLDVLISVARCFDFLNGVSRRHLLQNMASVLNSRSKQILKNYLYQWILQKKWKRKY